VERGEGRGQGKIHTNKKYKEKKIKVILEGGRVSNVIIYIVG